MAREVVSGDGYARFDERTTTWTIGTAAVEETLRFAEGRYLLTSLENKSSRRRVVASERPSAEFRISVDGAVHSGAEAGWVWKGGEAQVLSQGEIQLVVTLENDLLRVRKTYIVYPGTGIIRQWIVYQNRSARRITVKDPYFVTSRLWKYPGDRLSLYYMTGGGSYTGSQMLKEVPLASVYARTFDTKDQIERTELNGVSFGEALSYGSGAYMPWFCIREASSGNGLYVGLDYYGRWAAEIGNFQGGPGYIGLRLAGYQRELAPGESIETPKAFTGVFTGDLDAMGNQLKEWQYRYLWDFTSPEYFGKIRFLAQMRWHFGKVSIPYGGGTQDNWDYRLSALWHATEVMRYVGADILWQDAGWHDQLGDNDGPDFARVKRYLSKHGMGLAVWLPLWYVDQHSRTYREHPDWFAREGIDVSRKEVIDWMADQLNGKVAQWGDFQWRVDGTAVGPVDGNETPMLAQYHNVVRLKSEFRKRHPGSSIDLCSGGGNLMGFEGLRLSDVSQLTDGGSLSVSNYYSSYLFPPDKIDDWTRTSNFNWEHARSILTMAAAWMSDRGINGHEPGLSINDGMENLRRTFEIYHYLFREGVAGRWSRVYHPRVEGDDPIYYFQRLSQDGRRGAIILRRFTKGEVRIYPKGLRPEETYDLRFERSRRAYSRSGSDLMENGLLLVNPQPGELVYLGLPYLPGGGYDHVPPSPPASVRKRLGTNMGVTGVELEWTPSTDNNWLSHYLIYRDRKVIDKVAMGTYYFDHTEGPPAILAAYQVQAIDGDGNASGRVEAAEVGPRLVAYTAWGGYLSGEDHSYQGANHWSYEEWAGGKQSPMIWNGALGQMGLYEGTAGTRKARIGASWMRPGDMADSVRVFTAPHTGQVTISGIAHKDLYHLYGDGVQLKVLKGAAQLWPEAGWHSMRANDTAGTKMELRTSVHQGDKLYFIVNCGGDSVDDDTVWDPQIAYARIEGVLQRTFRTEVDDAGSAITYSGEGWQQQGISPYGGDRDQGYLPARIRGTLKVSGTPGDKLALKFQGTGVELIGDTGSDRGIASIRLDGRELGTTDAFVPENRYSISAHPSPIREPWNIATEPPIRLWGIEDLDDREHLLEVVVSGRKNKESTGTFIGVDAIVILNGSPVSPSPRK